MDKYEKLERIDEFNNVNPDVRLRDSFRPVSRLIDSYFYGMFRVTL